jgi:hypothetical protein
MHQNQVTGGGGGGADNWNLNAGAAIPLSVLAAIAKKKDKYGKNSELLRSLGQLSDLKNNKNAESRDRDHGRGAARAQATKVGKQAVEAAKSNLGDQVKSDAMSMGGLEVLNQVLGAIQQVASVIGMLSG